MILIQTMADVFHMLYLTFDHPQFFLNTGFITNWTEKQRAWLNWMVEGWWFLQTVCEILCHIVHIQDMQTQMQQLKQRRSQVMNMMSTLMEFNPATGASLKQRTSIAQDGRAAADPSNPTDKQGAQPQNGSTSQ